MKNKDEKYYRVYSNYLKQKYGTKVYKLPIKLRGSCPNRDGLIAKGGCIFCGEEGGSFENLNSEIDIKNQLIKNKTYISKRYKAKKYISYFQNFSNTYMEFEKFKRIIKSAIIDDVVEISISTRPDCISNKYLRFLKSIEEKYDINISLELGLQTVNYHTLKLINRGHTLSEFIDSVIRIKKFNFNICTHLILNLPWDEKEDVIESSKVISSLCVDQVKLHSLYIVKNTKLEDMYKNGEIKLISKQEYIKRVVMFLEHLKPDIVIQRLIGRAPKDNTVFVNWNTSWWKIKDDIIKYMKDNNTFQGKTFNYLNGSALKKLEKMRP